MDRAKITIKQAKERFEQGLPILISEADNMIHSLVMLKKRFEPDFDYQLSLFESRNGPGVQFFALKYDKVGQYRFENLAYSMQPVDPETNEDLVEITVNRREVWVQDVIVYLPKSSATVEKAIEMVENDEGEIDEEAATYSQTCGSDSWTVDGPTPELTRQFPKRSLDVG